MCIHVFASSELEDQTLHAFRDVHVFVTYWSSHVAGARACPGRRLTAHAHYIRDIMIPCYDHQLVEIVRGGSRGNSPAVREGL